MAKQIKSDVSYIPDIVLVIDDIRSVHNVGSIFRTADAFGVAKIFLCGFSPTPLDRYGRYRSDFEKVALGAERAVLWEYWDEPKEALYYLIKRNYTIVGVEQDSKSIPLFDYIPDQKIALVLGNENFGISKKNLDLIDIIVEIPMLGKKESLNVSVAAGIAMWHCISEFKKL